MSVLYYPQLPIGALAQYPAARNWSKRTIFNALQGGGRVVMQSPAPARVQFVLSYAGLSDVEFARLQALFTAAQGGFETFTFMDPIDNLLSWSEDFTASAWTIDPLIQPTKGNTDPFGGTAALRLTNAGQVAQRVIQSIAGPSWYQYCFSIYLRSDGPCSINVIRASASAEASQTVTAGSSWLRATISGSLSPQEDGVRFGLELPAGASIYAFGAQAEAQPSAGSYKATVDRGGIYPGSRFDQDSLSQVAGAWGQYSTEIRVISTY